VGRGGRGGQEAAAYLLFHQQDVARLQKGITDLPDPKKPWSSTIDFAADFKLQ
jgi:superfamily II DNA helicase RecQ